MAKPVLRMVDVVIPKLGEHWWNITEKGYFAEFSRLEPATFSTICSKAFEGVQSADFSESTKWIIDAYDSYPYDISGVYSGPGMVALSAVTNFTQKPRRWPCGELAE